MKRLNRRSFLTRTALATAAVSWTARSWSQVAGSNSDVRISVVGFGGRGQSHLTEFGKMSGVRINEELRVSHGKGKPGTGHIVLSTGLRDDEMPAKGDTLTWGKHAAWCDYWGKIGGKTVGIAMFDHPTNPVHPTTWHVRDYGLFAANPFGLHDFEKKEPGAGNLNIPAGQSVTFKYRLYIHEGDEKKAKVAERYQEYITKTAAQ